MALPAVSFFHTLKPTPVNMQIDQPHAWTPPKNLHQLIPPTHTWTIPVFFSGSGCLDSHINTVLSEWLITMYYSSKCTAAVWLMPHRKWSRSGVFVVWESVGGRHVRMWSGSVCGTVAVAAGECMYGACLMVVVLVRVCRCGVLLVR